MKREKNTQKYWLAAGVAAASCLAGCDSDGDKWAKSPGTNGFINLDAVKEAFIKNPEAGSFEGRANEIFEGDNLVIFSTKEVKGGFVYTALEDLNKNKKADSSDEVIFTLTVADGRATLQGYGVNKYYKDMWNYTPPKEDKEKEQKTQTHRYYHRGPYFHYWYYGRGWGRYYTPAPAYNKTASQRTDYRQGTSFKNQVKGNVDFENRMSKKYGSNFRKSVNDTSSIRKSYVSKTQRSSGFKNTLSTSKSGWSQRSGASKSSGFTSSRSSGGSKSGGGFGGHKGSSGFGI